jgi:hypothetical protein
MHMQSGGSVRIRTWQEGGAESISVATRALSKAVDRASRGNTAQEQWSDCAVTEMEALVNNARSRSVASDCHQDMNLLHTSHTPSLSFFHPNVVFLNGISL